VGTKFAHLGVAAAHGCVHGAPAGHRLRGLVLDLRGGTPPTRVAERGPDGYTRAQRFFVSYGQYYCRAERPMFARENLRDDPHAPSRYRVNGPLSNLPAFAEAFSCRTDAAMVRPAPSRCAVW
jgi:hypothetical protein